MPKILLIEDDADLLESLKKWLIADKYTVDAVIDGIDGYERLRYSYYDIAILDWNLPGMSGIEICKQFRAAQGQTPILMLTGKGASKEKVIGLDAGADDYLTKPFSMHELSARLRALLKRPPARILEKLTVSHLVMDSARYEVTANGVEIHLLPKEFSLLEFLMRHPDQVFSAEALIERVWHTDSSSTSGALKTCMMRLRSKISCGGDDDSLIQTIPKVGYILRSK